MEARKTEKKKSGRKRIACEPDSGKGGVPKIDQCQRRFPVNGGHFDAED